METYINHTPETDASTVAQLAIAHPGALAVFTKYNIDYCCGGHRSLQEACYRIGLDPEKIRKEIAESSSQVSEPLRFENWRAALLADFIVQNHHAYVKHAIPELAALLDRVCERHGHDVFELLKIRQCFIEVADELTYHMEKEELVLFPAIKRLEAQSGNDHPMERTILAPIAMMEDEHEAAGELIKEIRSLSNNYTPPEFACPTFRITFQKLKEFDDDLMKHIHLENNILFQRFKKQN